MNKKVFKNLTFCMLLTILILSLVSCSSSEKKEKGAVNKSSAIDEYLFGKEDTSEKLRNAYQSIESDTLKCMNDKGWEYYKTEISDENLSIGIFQDYTGFSNIDQREKFGYGVFTTLDSDGQQNEELANEYYGFTDDNGDKNGDYVATLSETENSKYYEDLYGVDPSIYSEDGEADNSGSSDLDTGEGSISQETENPGLSDTSCSGAASKKAFGDLSTLQTVFEDSQDAVDKFYKNKEVKSAFSKWQSCVKDGLDKTGKTEINKALDKTLAEKEISDMSPNEIINISLQDILSTLQGYNYDEILEDGGDSSISVDTAPIDEEISYDDSDYQEPKSFNPNKYATQELKIAALDFKCQDDKYNSVRYEQQRIIEEKFIEDHKDEFISLKKSLSN